MSVIDRFLKYVKIDTKSDMKSKTCPSTDIQFDFGKVLVEELKEMGIKEVIHDENGYIYAKIPGNVDAPAVGFIAHLDTAPDFNGTNVNPQIVKNYDGKDIVLNDEVTLSPSIFTSLNNYVGEDLITTDGTTLLGADDKAGVASIMTMAEYFINNDVYHGDICIGFTPDEEIGRGADLFNVELFGADFAYTIDGGRVGEIVYENFNAASANITIKGRSVHPGSAKNKMINASVVLMEFLSMLPSNERPEHTEQYEGFNHVTYMQAKCEEARSLVIIRDHDKDKFEQKKQMHEQITKLLNIKYGEGTVTCEIKDSYYNMKEIIEDGNMHIIDTAIEAMKSLDIIPLFDPIRGGTDGSRLSYMGLPCPNLFTGGHNFHGPYEYIPISSLEKSVEVQKKIIELFAKY